MLLYCCQVVQYQQTNKRHGRWQTLSKKLSTKAIVTLFLLTTMEVRILALVVLPTILIVKNVKRRNKMTKEQIETEAAKRYIKGSASYHAFIFGAEWVLEKGVNND